MFEALFKYPESVFAGSEFLFVNLLDPVWWLLTAVVAAVLVGLSMALGRRARNLGAVQRVVLASLQLSAVGLVVVLPLMWAP